MKILCFGDSNTYGYDPRSCFGERYEECWTDLLARDLGCAVINAGENGREIPRRDAELQRFCRLLHIHHPDLLIVMLGTNDLLQGNTPEAVAKRMEHFLSRIPLDRSKLLLIAPPPMKLGGWVPDQILVDGSGALHRLYGNLAGQLGIRYQNWEMPVAFDGVHLTQEGHRILGSRLSEFIKSEVRDEQHQ